MKSKRSVYFYILTAAIFSIVYVLFATRPLGTEYQFKPEWRIDVTNPSVKPEKISESELFFKLGQTMGYFTQDGEVTNFISYPFKSTITKDNYISYNSNNNSAVIYKKDGSVQGKINISGYPMLDENRIFIFLPGGASFIMCREDGTRNWEYSGTIPITAFDSSKTAVAVGFADGNICLLNLEGSTLQKFSAGGSSYAVISGIAVSSDANYVAAICGHEKQRLILADTSSTHSKIVFHEFLDSDDSFQKLVKFSNDNSFVYYAAGNNFAAIDVKNTKSKKINIKGNAISLQENKTNIFLLTNQNDNFNVYIIEKDCMKTGYFSFKAKNAYIQANEEKLYVGRDSSISCIKISKE